MRVRRTNQELTRDIFDAVTKVSQEVGLTGVTLKAVAKEARIDLKVLKRRFPTELALLDAYASRIDDKVSTFFQENQDYPKPEKYLRVFNQYLDWVRSDSLLRDILTWELTDTTNISFQSSQHRDRHLVQLLAEDFAPQKKGSRKEQIRQKIVLYLAGLTYLSLYRDDQNFVGFNPNSAEWRTSLNSILIKLFEAYFSEEQ